MRRRLLLSYLLGALVLLVALEVPLGVLAANRELDAVRASARQDATILAALASSSLEHPGESRGPDLDDLTGRYAAETGAEVVVTDAAGARVAYQPAPDERATPDPTPDAAEATKVALSGRTRVTTTTDDGRPVVAAAVPVTDGRGTVHGVVEVVLPAVAAEHRVRVIAVGLTAFAGLALLLVAVVGELQARSVTRPLANLETAVGRLEAGDLDARAAPSGPNELRSLGLSFNQMADRLGELVRSHRRFIADASHQLRSPLTALRLRLEAVDVDDPDSTRRHVEGAIAETGRLSRLVDGLLELARAEGQRPQRALVDVPEVLRQRVDVWEALATERGVRLEVELPREPVLAVAVPGHLEQILDNALANALEVAPRGSVIELRAGPDPSSSDRVAVSVVDAGPGMTEEQRRNAFERFWQEDDRKTGATGLGLAISHQLALVSGGDLLLEEADTGGLEARVVLARGSRSTGAAHQG